MLHSGRASVVQLSARVTHTRTHTNARRAPFSPLRWTLEVAQSNRVLPRSSSLWCENQQLRDRPGSSVAAPHKEAHHQGNVVNSHAKFVVGSVGRSRPGANLPRTLAAVNSTSACALEHPPHRPSAATGVKRLVHLHEGSHVNNGFFAVPSLARFCCSHDVRQLLVQS